MLYLKLIKLCSENTAQGRRVTKLDQILLNGINIAMVTMIIKIVTRLMNLSLFNNYRWYLVAKCQIYNLR